MKKYLIGGFIGFLIMPLSFILFILAKFGPEPFYSLLLMGNQPNLPEELEKYHQSAAPYYTDYGLEAPFLDDDSLISHSRDLGIYREEPIQQWSKGDYTSVCLNSFDSTAFDVAVTLSPDARKTLLKSLEFTNEKFTDSLADGGYEKRYYIEAGGNRIFWFWVTGGGAKSYAEAIKKTPEKPDFILKVPLEQLYNFQFYLVNGMIDQPLKGCTPNINPNQIPAWQDVVIPFWEDHFQTLKEMGSGY